MIFYCYSFLDKKIDAFTVPTFSEKEKEKFVIEVERSLKASEDPRYLLRFKDYELVLLGTFDDELGHFEPISSTEYYETVTTFEDLCVKCMNRIGQPYRTTEEKIRVLYDALGNMNRKLDVISSKICDPLEKEALKDA